MMQADELLTFFNGLGQRFVLNFAIYLRMPVSITALEDWVQLSWRLARVDRKFGFCVKKALKMFTKTVYQEINVLFV